MSPPLPPSPAPTTALPPVWSSWLVAGAATAISAAGAITSVVAAAPAAVGTLEGPAAVTSEDGPSVSLDCSLDILVGLKVLVSLEPRPKWTMGDAENDRFEPECLKKGLTATRNVQREQSETKPRWC